MADVPLDVALPLVNCDEESEAHLSFEGESSEDRLYGTGTGLRVGMMVYVARIRPDLLGVQA